MLFGGFHAAMDTATMIRAECESGTFKVANQNGDRWMMVESCAIAEQCPPTQLTHLLWFLD